MKEITHSTQSQFIITARINSVFSLITMWQHIDDSQFPPEIGKSSNYVLKKVR